MEVCGGPVYLLSDIKQVEDSGKEYGHRDEEFDPLSTYTDDTVCGECQGKAMGDGKNRGKGHHLFPVPVGKGQNQGCKEEDVVIGRRVHYVVEPEF